MEEAANREDDKILNKAFHNIDYCRQYLYVPCFQIVMVVCDLLTSLQSAQSRIGTLEITWQLASIWKMFQTKLLFLPMCRMDVLAKIIYQISSDRS